MPFIIFAAAAIAATPPARTPEKRLQAIVAPVSAARIKATVEKLVSFGTRHTLSSQTDPKRGIGASLRWTEAEFRSMGLATVTPSEVMTNDRAPAGEIGRAHV